MNGFFCISLTWHRFKQQLIKNHKKENCLRQTTDETVNCSFPNFLPMICDKFSLTSSFIEQNMGQKIRLKLAFQILCFTRRALPQIWSDTYLHCWKHRSLSAMLIHRHALEISCVCCYSHECLMYPITILKVTSSVSHWAPASVAWIQHVMGFVREQLCLLVYWIHSAW